LVRRTVELVLVAVNGDGGIDQVTAECAQTRQSAIFIGAGQSAEADHIGGQNRRELPGLGHGFAPLAIARLAHRGVRIGDDIY